MSKLNKATLSSALGSSRRSLGPISGLLVFALVGGLVLMKAIETVPAGHVKVGTLFGKVGKSTIAEGFHIVNPLKKWIPYDCRQKTFKAEDIAVPSQDQLTTLIDWSVQYHADCKMAPVMLQETGVVEQVVNVHLVPQLRSLVREKGKSISKAEDYFTETVQTQLQTTVLDDLRGTLASKGIAVDDVLIRHIQLPQFIMEAIEQKKAREQEAEKQRAELERFRIEQEQKVASAEAEKNAAELEAQKIRLLAQAQAEANELIARSLTPNLVSYRAIERWNGTLPQFTGGDNAMPLLQLPGR